MITRRKPTACEELERLENALTESMLTATEQDLREELRAAGSDPDALIGEIDATIARARAECSRQRMATARAEIAAWRDQGVKPNKLALDEARNRLQRLRSGDSELDSRMMLAARKGEGLSERDMEGLLEDLAELERLEREKGNE
jgi:hypothetical protein